MKKSIKVSKRNWERLRATKFIKELASMDEVIDMLYKKAKIKGVKKIDL